MMAGHVAPLPSKQTRHMRVKNGKAFAWLESSTRQGAPAVFELAMQFLGEKAKEEICNWQVISKVAENIPTPFGLERNRCQQQVRSGREDQRTQMNNFFPALPWILI